MIFANTQRSENVGNWKILTVLTEKFNRELIQAQAAGSQDFAFPGRITGDGQEEKGEVRRQKY